MSKPYEMITLEDGRAARRYESGLILDHETGRICHPPEDKIIRTTKRSSELRAIWTQQKWQAVEEGLAAASPSNKPADTIARIVEKRSKVAMKDPGRAGNEAARIIFQVSGLTGSIDGPGAEGVNIKISSNLARDLISQVIAAKNQRIEKDV